MKTHFLLLPLLAVLAACDPLGDGLDAFRLRSACGPHGPGEGRAREGGTTPDGPEPLPLDTTLLFSAVRFPDGYDWPRDTAYGSVPFQLLLYKDFEPVLTLPSGADACFVPDPDRHHLLSGHLYTERMADGATRIGRDGVELFRFPGREYLVGLLEDGEDLFTLSRPAKGPGFSFRKNGEALVCRTDGMPFGDLSDPSYGATGALYRDQGQVCFCFTAGDAAGRSFHSVRDGHETRLDGVGPGSQVLDLKLSDGQVLVLDSSFQGYQLHDGRIWPDGKGFSVTGRFSTTASGTFSGFLADGSRDEPTLLCREEAVLYHTGRTASAVSVDEAGTVHWCNLKENGQEQLPCYFLSPGCAVFTGSLPWLALTPRDTRRRPFVRIGTRVREVDINGYVSSLSVTIIRPAKKASGSHPGRP